MKHSILTIAMILGLLCINTAYGSRPAISIPNPLKAALDGLSDRAKSLLDAATNNGLILETSGAEQALNLIANARLAYEKDLKATSGTISSQEQQVLSGITGVLNQIQNHTITNVSAQITKVALMIPFVGDYPELTTWSGNILFPNQNNVSIKLEGVFKYVGSSGFAPFMKIGNSIYQASEKTQTHLSFDIPVQKLKFLRNNVNFDTVAFEFPYQQHFWLAKKNVEYKVKLIMLPANPGKFEFFISTTVNQVVRKDRACDLSWAGHEDLMKYCYPEPGWVIDVSTVHRTLSGERGKGFGHDHYDLGSDFTKPEVGIGYHIKGDDDDSFVSYHITYSMTQEVPVPVDQSAGLAVIKWGDSKIYTKTDDKATWKAVYTQFDGRQVGFVTSNESNPYIRVNQVGNQIIVTMAPFD